MATLAAHFPAVPAARWLDAATRGGARALGLRGSARSTPGARPGVLDVLVDDIGRAARVAGARSRTAVADARWRWVAPPHEPPQRAMNQVVKFGRMIKFEHTLFALPFALAAAAIAARGHGLSIARVAGIVVAMAGARTAAMGFNRIVDRHIDARNPRTAGRELPTGRDLAARRLGADRSRASTVFLAAAAALGPLCLALAPVALAILLGYSLTKRFTALCHLFLGLAIAGGPAGAWIAVRGDFGWAPGLLMLAVGCWIAGFDILYALADRDFDRAAGLHSIPARLGVTGALVVSALLHAVTVAALFALAPAAGPRRPLPRRRRGRRRPPRLGARDRPPERSLPPQRRLLQPERLRLGRVLRDARRLARRASRLRRDQAFAEIRAGEARVRTASRACRGSVARRRPAE